MNEIMQILGASNGEDFDFHSPQSWAFVIMLAIALLYGVTLSMLYSVYFREGEAQDPGLARSLIFLTPTLMTIFWVVQFSLPLSVGLVGTLSFVRFRSPVKRAEDVSFLVVALACAISCAVHKPLIGGLLVLVFLCYALCRNYLWQKESIAQQWVTITYITSENMTFSDVEKMLRTAECSTYELLNATIKDGTTTITFKVPASQKNKLGTFTHQLKEADAHSNINVIFPQTQLGSP